MKYSDSRAERREQKIAKRLELSRTDSYSGGPATLHVYMLDEPGSVMLHIGGFSPYYVLTSADAIALIHFLQEAT